MLLLHTPAVAVKPEPLPEAPTKVLGPNSVPDSVPASVPAHEPVTNLQVVQVQPAESAAAAPKPDSLQGAASQSHLAVSLAESKAAVDLPGSNAHSLLSLSQAQSEDPAADADTTAADADTTADVTPLTSEGLNGTSAVSHMSLDTASEPRAATQSGLGWVSGSSGHVKRTLADRVDLLAVPNVESLPSGSAQSEDWGHGTNGSLCEGSGMGTLPEQVAKRPRTDESVAEPAHGQPTAAAARLSSDFGVDASFLQDAVQSPVPQADKAEAAVDTAPRLTSKDGSPSTAAHVRSGTASYRVKTPMRPKTDAK